MAFPAQMTTLDLSGKYTMNKSQSDPVDEILRLQGIGWVVRKAIGLASLTLDVKHYKDDAGVEHIDIDQTITGGIRGTREERVVDWKRYELSDHIFGEFIGQCKRVRLKEVEDEYLKKGWTPDVEEHGLIYSHVESNTPKSGRKWIVVQTWGFELVDGVRKHTRHLRFTGPKDENVTARLVYDYLG